MTKRMNGEGTIAYNAARKRWEGRLTVAFDDDGKPVRRKVTGRTKSEVSTRLRRLREAADAGVAPARKDLTVGRYLDTWLDGLPGTVALATETQYRDVVRLYVKPHLGRKRLATLSPTDVTRMLHALETEGRSPNTRRLARSVLRRSLRRAEVEGLLTRNAAALANGVRLGTVQYRAVSAEDARKLIAYVADDRLAAAFTVALALGLRRGELLGLAWDDVELDAKPARLTVHRALKRVPSRGLALDDTKTAQSRRTINLPKPVADALRTHRRHQREERLEAGHAWTAMPFGTDLVFRTRFGTAVDPDNFRNLCYSVTEAAGIGRRSPHELRHAAASLLIAQGVPLKLVSETLGHTSIRITADVYGHLYDDAREVAADAMTTALWGE